MSKRIQIQKNYEKVTSWEDADSCLKRIAVMTASIQKDEAEYNKKEQELRNTLTIKHAPMREQIQSLGLGLEDFCKEHRADFGDKKSKEMKHGIVSFRIHPPSVEKLKGITWAGVIELIRQSKKWASRFIRVKEDVNKEAIITANANGDIKQDELKAIMLDIIQHETFGYELKFAVNQ